LVFGAKFRKVPYALGLQCAGRAHGARLKTQFKYSLFANSVQQRRCLSEAPGALHTSTRSLRPRTPKHDTVKPSTPPSRHDTDEAFRTEQDSLIGKRVTKYFLGHGAFHGTVKEYGIITDNYLLVYDDGDRETIKYPEFLHILPGHPEFTSVQANFIALSACLEQEIKNTRFNTRYFHYHAHAAIEPLEPNSWKEMRKNTHADKWQLAGDEEMDSLRKLN
jgi:hypothetical protein